MEKTIGELAALVEGAVVIGDQAAVLTGIEHDSRKVGKGTLFVCIAGLHADGHDFIPQAVKQGAAAIMTERDIEPPAGITVLKVPQLQAALDAMVPSFYDYPARQMRVIGITGTNGKTTTSYMIRAILRQAGYKVGLIGTIQILIEEKKYPIHNTTPDVVELQHTLYEMQQQGMDYVVMEVSSHALAQERVAGIEFDTAVFTNLTQDHLDYHKTMENYKLAKAKLFELVGRPGTKEGKSAVVNVDDEAGRTMLEHAQCQHLTYGIYERKAMLRATSVQVRAQGASFTLNHAAFGKMQLDLKITGIFNVYNVMSAVGAALAEHIAPEIIRGALAAFKSVPGRFELVDAGQCFSVIVDYAHTPDGLENILHTARQIAKKRIITVFGCGGDRDRTKRPIMGRIAAELSDVVLATSDNPRSEDPEAILAEVESGVKEKLGGKQHEKITDRRAAIFRAIELAGPDDIVVIAGKGHEDYQILRDRTIHFDDKEVAREAIRGKMACHHSN
jgi:UDP-N-acetylmuramoyl-L-alanyl-D-glutamate--2,6-diaminopimelate ligase/murE/murF fusion protein